MLKKQNRNCYKPDNPTRFYLPWLMALLLNFGKAQNRIVIVTDLSVINIAFIRFFD